MKPPPTLIRLILIAALASRSGAPARASLLTIAATGETAPGGGTFGTNFGVPVINAAGQVAFTTFTNDPAATDRGAYQGTSSSDLAAVVRVDGVGVTSVGRQVAQSASGEVTLLINAGTQIVAHETNGPLLVTVASVGDTFQLVGGGGPIYTIYFLGDPLINDQGQIAYLAGSFLFVSGLVEAYFGEGDLANGQLQGFLGPISLGAHGETAFFAGANFTGFVTPKAALTTADDLGFVFDIFDGDQFGGSYIAFNASTSAPILSAAGITFRSTISNGVTSNPGVFFVQNSGLATIAKSGDPAPGGGTFASTTGGGILPFDEPQINDNGSIVFVGWTDGGPGHGVYRYTKAHGLEAMALEGHAPYAAAAGFRNAVINNHDVVAFQAYDGSAGNSRGVYLTDGTTTVRAGSDNFFGAEGRETGAFSQAFFGSPAEGLSPLNDRAQVTFVNSRGLTSQSVMKFTFDPSWAQPGGGAWDTAANWTFSVDPVADSAVAIPGQAAGPLLVTGPAAATTVAVLAMGGPQVAELDLQSSGPLTATEQLRVGTNGVLGGKGAVTTPDLEVYAGGRVTGPPILNAPVYNSGTMDGDFTVNGNVTNDVTGSIIGNETFNGNVTNLGTISPGHSPGTVTVNGDLTLQSMTDQGVLTGSVLEIEIGGPNPGDFDVINVTGHVTLAGTLHVALLDGFTPSPGQKFHILNAGSTSGTFDAITGASVTVTADGIDVEATTSDTSTTTTLPGGTTTTTLPVSPCADRTGFEGVQCVCAGGLSAAACTGDRVPAAIGKLFTRGCTLMHHAAGLVTSKKVKKIVHSAGATFAKDIARVTKAATARKHPLSQACGATLAGTLGDAKERADQIGSTL